MNHYKTFILLMLFPLTSIDKKVLKAFIIFLFGFEGKEKQNKNYLMDGKEKSINREKGLILLY